MEEYTKIVEKQGSTNAPLTSSEQDIISAYESIYDAIKLVYEYTNQNTWNSMEISNIFNTEGLKRQKMNLLQWQKQVN